MSTEKSTIEELQKRKIEFLEKLKNLLDEYMAVVNYNHYSGDENPYCFEIITDGHIAESWGNKTVLKDLDEDSIDEYIKQLK